MKQIVNPMQLYAYEVMETDIANLVERYSDLLQVKVIGSTIEGRKLYSLKLGRGQTEIFFNGAHHAREWMTSALLMNMIEIYCHLYEEKGTIDGYDVRNTLNKCSMYFVPMVNPDGVTLVQRGFARTTFANEVLQLNKGNKDFSSWKANIRGVDLNRQYPADWDKIKDNTGNPAPLKYKGPRPVSEPEVKALIDFTLKHNFETAVSYHSSGEEIFWKYKSKGELLKTSKQWADKLSEHTGYQLVNPGVNPSGGGYTDWFISYCKKPAFTLEISPYIGPRPVPLKNYLKIWQDNRAVGMLLATAVLQKSNE